MAVSSKVTINKTRVKQLQKAQITALEKTAEAIHTNLVQSQTMPFGIGTLQNDSTFADLSESNKGHASLVSSTPYARRLYFHPEYDFSTDENPNAGAQWYEPYLEGGTKADYASKVYKRFYKKEADI